MAKQAIDTGQHITDHPFVPTTEWWTRCKVCHLAEAAHKASILSDPAEHVKELVKNLGFLGHTGPPDGSYALGGSAVLALRGIRPIRDLDVYVSQGFYRRLIMWEGWTEWEPNPHDPVAFNRQKYLMKVQDHITCTAAREWKHQGAPQRIEVQDFVTEPEMVKGFPCIPLHVIFEWKKIVRRPKDVQDIQLIEEFLSR